MGSKTRGAAVRRRVGGIFAVAVLWVVMTTGCYTLQQGAGQFRLIGNSKPIEKIIDEPENEEYRDMLSLVDQILVYTQDELGLKTKRNYRKYYHTDENAIVHVVTASKSLALEPYEWNFPIIGRVPYKGYFDIADAREQARELIDQNYDVWMRPVPAYSTLGWFADPVTTPMLRRGVYYLVNTIIHESVHTTLYVNGQGNFNEQLATFVATTATPDFFLRYYPGEGAEVLAAQSEAQERAGEFFELMFQTYQVADEMYRDETLTDDEKREQKEKLFENTEEKIRQIYPHIPEDADLINNARLLQFRRYRRDNPVFQEIWERADGDWGAFWEEVRAKVKKPGVRRLDEWSVQEEDGHEEATAR